VKEKMSKISLQDIAVIYFSPADESWVAHSVYTDQLGLGLTPTKALAELMRLVDKLLAMASTDDSIEYLRKAPEEVIDRLKKCKPFPLEWFEVAHNIARGTYPDGSVEEPADALDADTYSANLGENLCAAA